MSNLFLKIEQAERWGEEIDDYRDALCELSRHSESTFAIVSALMDAVLEEEKLWRQIEERADFQAQYSNREQARNGFLREYFSKRQTR